MPLVHETPVHVYYCYVYSYLCLLYMLFIVIYIAIYASCTCYIIVMYIALYASCTCYNCYVLFMPLVAILLLCI